MNRPWDILFICWSKSVTATAAAEDTRIVTATPAPNQTAAESTSEQVERVPLDKTLDQKGEHNVAEALGHEKSEKAKKQQK